MGCFTLNWPTVCHCFVMSRGWKLTERLKLDTVTSQRRTTESSKSFKIKARLLIEKPCDRETPTKNLLKMSDDLSIHQIGALRTVTLIKKVLLTGKPTYLSERLMPRIGSQRFGMMLTQDRAPLSLIREGFIYRGISLFNNLPDALKIEAKLSKFKSAARRWIQKNVAVKP